ncbi:MAG TPA: LysE family translocator [Verrucomicrobiae bacterium]
MLLAFVTGFATGFISSIPVGPINVTIVQEGAQRGFRWAFFIGLGAVVMESIYSFVGFTGFSELFTSKLLRSCLELVSFILVLYLGIQFLRAKKLSVNPESVERLEERIERKIHHPTAFLTGFIRVLANPAILLFWITISASFISHELVAPTLRSKASCVLGVACGALSWFTILSYGVSLGHGKFSDRTLLRLSHVSGVFMLGMAVIIAYKLVLLLWRAHHQ